MDAAVTIALCVLLLLAGASHCSEQPTTLTEYYAYQHLLMLQRLHQDMTNITSPPPPPSCSCPLFPEEEGSAAIDDSSVSLLGLREEFAISSCRDLQHHHPSRYYFVATETSPPRYMYCETDRSFNGSRRGNWLRVANLDMRIQTETCPTGFKTVAVGDGTTKRYCTRKGVGCTSHFFPVHGYKYRMICGKVIAYQMGKPDAFFPSYPHPRTIDEVYVDGVSITCGLPRRHIWTFAAAMQEVRQHGLHLCRCTHLGLSRRKRLAPGFIGEDYFCDTGSASSAEVGRLYDTNPLWDGSGCGPKHNCCRRQGNQEFFCGSLGYASMDPIEVRLCGDQLDEEIFLEQLQLFVQ